MTVLLFLTAAMLAVSGAVKLKATARAGLGLAPLALLEMAAAVGLAILALPGMPAETLSRWSVPAAVLLLLGSSVSHAIRQRTHRRRRAETEGGRLANYLKHISGPPSV